MQIALRSTRIVRVTQIEVTVEIAKTEQTMIDNAMGADLPDDLYPYFVDADVEVKDLEYSYANQTCCVIIEAVKEVEEVE
jgi:hypothetical protein